MATMTTNARRSRWAGKLRPRTKDTKGKPVEVDTDAPKLGRIRNPSLSDSLLLRIRAIHATIKDAYNVPLEQFEIGFMRDGNPEREVGVWERLVVAFENVSQKMPEVSRKIILRTLLAYSMRALTPAERADPVVKKIIEIGEGKECVTS